MYTSAYIMAIFDSRDMATSSQFDDSFAPTAISITEMPREFPSCFLQ